MAKKTKTEVPEPKTNGKELAPVAQAPKALAQSSGTKLAGKGFENLEREDLLIPRIKLLQPLSPEVSGDLEQEAGTIFLNLSNKNLGKEIMITPIMHYRSRILWTPKDDGGGIDCSAPDAKTPKETKYATNCAACPKKDWDNEAKKEKDKQPKCTMYENFVVLTGDSTEPVVLSMERSKMKVAKRWYSSMALKGGDMADHVYKLAVVKEKNSNDEAFFNYVVSDTGKKTAADKKAICDRIWESLSKATIVTKEDAPEESLQPAEAGSGGKY